MSVSIKLDEQTGDLAFVDGEFQLINTKEELSRQQLFLRFNMIRGTWFRNLNTGLPLLKNENNPVQILGAVPKPVFDSYIKEEALKCEFITDIEDYASTLNKQTRAMPVSLRAITEEGKLDFTDIPISL